MEKNKVDSMQIVGDVAGRTCIIVDDMVDTAGTLVKGVGLLKARFSIHVVKRRKKFAVKAVHSLGIGFVYERDKNPVLRFWQQMRIPSLVLGLDAERQRVDLDDLK